jgi:hypothetical protein
MDAGSGINLIYTRTLKAMSISLNLLQPIDCSFHGIVPGSANYPLGKSKTRRLLWKSSKLLVRKTGI